MRRTVSNSPLASLFSHRRCSAAWPLASPARHGRRSPPLPLAAARHCSRSPVALTTARARRCSCSSLAFAELGDGAGLHRGGAGVAAAFAGVGDGAGLHRGGAGLHAGVAAAFARVMNSLITSLVIEVMGFIIMSPRIRPVLPLPLIAGSYRTRGKQPILPSKIHVPSLNLGRATTHKNMILGM